MLAPLLALAMIPLPHQLQQSPATPVARVISNARWDEAVTILAKAPHPVHVRFVYVGKLDPDAPDSYFFNQMISIFSQLKHQWIITAIAEMSQRDAGPMLGQGIGCSAIDADSDTRKIMSNAMATMGYPCAHAAAGYAAPAPDITDPSGRRPLIFHSPIQELVISIGK